jgi:hypothetical protein
MSFDYQGLAFNLLDTPGRQDFSDPYIAGREFAVDSPLEGGGFELPVPGDRACGFEAVGVIGFV